MISNDPPSPVEPWRKSAMDRLSQVRISPEADIAAAGRQLDETGLGALVVCADDGRFRALLTDGDFRRAILDNLDMTQSCETIATREPVSLPREFSRKEAIEQLNHGKAFPVNHLPIVDADQILLGLLLRRDLFQSDGLQMEAVIMAGGFGKRLRPLTVDTPKPMLPVGGQPLLERIIGRMSRAGIQRINVTTHHSPQKIMSHFGDGSEFGVDINYVNEDQPLGTAGSLGLIAEPTKPLLVMNGDILTDIDFEAMLAFHQTHEAALTVAVRQYDFKVPYGVMCCDGHVVQGVSEKPVQSFLVNAGIYMIEPSVHRDIPSDRRMDMTEFIELNLSKGRRVVSFPVIEYWLDIGQHEDFERANEDIRRGVVRS